MTDYQRVIAEIDLDALAENMKNIRKITHKDAKIMGIVKADAYGHGAVEVSKVLLYNGADWLGVAIVDEAVQLRKNNIYVPILILGYTPQLKLNEVVEYDLIQTIFSFETALELSEIAKKHNKIAKIHIKIDTGMGRIGFIPSEDAVQEIVKISKLENIEINGIFTHFSTADEKDKTFTRHQEKLFRGIINELSKRGIDIPVKHAANSAGIMDFDDLCFNMVRPGVILYGMYPSDDVIKDNLKLKPVMSIKTHISYVKTVGASVPIGYGRTFVTEKESIIATVPIGYADGYIRAMNKGGRVLIHGQFAPIIGKICMDQLMVDITDIKGVVADDEVVILGSQGENTITAEEIASVLETINYEVVCMIGKRVPRQYLKKNSILKTVKYV